MQAGDRAKDTYANQLALDEADAKFTESLEIARARGFRDIAVSSSTWLGVDANWRGDFRRAVSLARG